MSSSTCQAQSHPRAPKHGTRTGATPGPTPSAVDPAWTRLLTACLLPVLLASSASLPTWVRLILTIVMILAAAQGWPALVRAHHCRPDSMVIAVSGVSASIAVFVTHDFGAAATVMGISIIAAFVAQMARGNKRSEVVEDISAAVTGMLVMMSGAAWCAFEPGVANPALIVPICLALFVGPLLTILDMPARLLESTTVTASALVSALAGLTLALSGFFGPDHTTFTPAMMTALVCMIAGVVVGVLMASGNRVMWTHVWVPGGRAAIASALVPVLAAGGPTYAIARLLSVYLAG
ncbi:tellurium resistance protein TerC [Actinomyces vulturis]|uniref:tellurium resistance protein TerC n=1 Tax=Actinomyces vulturis TaxID=1857645 RepID=UPI000A996A7F|nr:tellurium resistance protein TerC [Actinomyces vulturis]